MLILTRKEGESLRLGDDITVTVVSVKGGNVRLGVSAPKDVAIHREEVYERVAAEREATGSAGSGEPSDQKTRAADSEV